MTEFITSGLRYISTLQFREWLTHKYTGCARVNSTQGAAVRQQGSTNITEVLIQIIRKKLKPGGRAVFIVPVVGHSDLIDSSQQVDVVSDELAQFYHTKGSLAQSMLPGEIPPMVQYISIFIIVNSIIMYTH
jgi:hypothetical protein